MEVTERSKTGPEIYEELNKYFINVKVSLTTHPSDQMTCTQIITWPISQSMFIKPTTRNKITKTINRIKTSIAVGHNDISIYMHKQCEEHLIEFLVKKSLSTGEVPKVVLVPVLKSASAKVLKLSAYFHPSNHLETL